MNYSRLALSHWSDSKLNYSAAHIMLQILSQLILFDFILYIPVNNFQLCRDGSSWVEPLMCLAQGHSPVTLLRLEPATPRSRVKHSTTDQATALPLEPINVHKMFSCGTKAN